MVWNEDCREARKGWRQGVLGPLDPLHMYRKCWASFQDLTRRTESLFEDIVSFLWETQNATPGCCHSGSNSCGAKDVL